MMNLFLAVAVLFTAVAGAAQTPDGLGTKQIRELSSLQVRVLAASSVRALARPGFTWWGRPVCDADEDVYFHIGEPDGIEFLEFSHDGETEQSFKFASDLNITYHFADYTVTGSGVLHALLETEDALYDVGFKSDGTAGAVTRLNAPQFLSGKLAVFDSGTILLMAHFSALASEKLRGKSYVALFSNSGKLLKELNTGFKATDVGMVASTLSEGALAIGDDGNVYILRSDEVVVVSEGGEILRRLPFKKVNDSQVATRVMPSGGLIAIVLSRIEGKDPERRVSNQYLLLDSNSGEPFRLYEASRELGSQPACFSRSEGFTFLHNDSGRLSKVTAEIR